jgi:flavin reductase (DIM6/NTAB) family NADH-FMN oxidoreductase RutF
LKWHENKFDSDADEFAQVGLEKESCEVVAPPRIKGAPIAFECVLERIIRVGNLDDHVVWGEVVRFHIHDDLYLDRGRIDTGAEAKRTGIKARSLLRKRCRRGALVA